MSKANTGADIFTRHDAMTRWRRLGRPRVFVAWSEETKGTAELICRRLDDKGLPAWVSAKIEWGAPFRRKIREAILGADLVIAVFPDQPSRWQIAEAGLAYFEQKLLPVVVIDGDEEIKVVEPFSELQVRQLSRTDVERQGGESLLGLVHDVREKLGEGSSTDRVARFCRFANKLFHAGVPIVGVAFVCFLIVAGSASTQHQLDFLRAGHIVFGAIVYGGAAFVALIFARAGVSTSFSERQFGFRVGQRLFAAWLSVALVQFFIGLALLYESPVHSYRDGWVFISIMAYLFSLGLFYAGYDRYRSSNEADRDGKPLRTLAALCFAGNLSFGLGITSATLVIVLMSLKDAVPWLGDS